MVKGRARPGCPASTRRTLRTPLPRPLSTHVHAHTSAPLTPPPPTHPTPLICLPQILKGLLKAGQQVYVSMDWTDALPKKQQVRSVCSFGPTPHLNLPPPQ